MWQYKDDFYWVKDQTGACVSCYLACAKKRCALLERGGAPTYELTQFWEVAILYSIQLAMWRVVRSCGIGGCYPFTLGCPFPSKWCAPPHQVVRPPSLGFFNLLIYIGASSPFVIRSGYVKLCCCNTHSGCWNKT